MSFTPNKQQLADFLKKVDENLIQLPDFQRGWVWDDDRIKSLIVSVAKGFPIGSIMCLAYDANSTNDVKFQTRTIENVINNYNNSAQMLLLDGQQRITSLYGSLMAKQAIQVEDRKEKLFYYINLREFADGNLEDAIFSIPANRIQKENSSLEISGIDLSTAQKEYETECFPLNKIFDYSDWQSGFVQSRGNDCFAERFKFFEYFRTNFIDKITKYEVPTIELSKDTPLNAICLIFEKVNTGGVALDVFELLTAKYAASNYPLRDDWFHASDKHKSGHITTKLRKLPLLNLLEKTQFLQIVTLLSTFNNDEHPLCTKEAVLKLSLPEYNKYKDQACDGLKLVAEFLHSEKILHCKDIPYHNQLVPLAAILAILHKEYKSDNIRQKIRQWYWCGVFGEMYGSATETKAAKDVKEVVNWINKNGNQPTTIERSSFREDRIDEVSTKRSAVYKGVLALILQNKDCLDFKSCKRLDTSIHFDNPLDHHHIFPQDWCEKNNIDPFQTHSIVNKAIISTSVNRAIGGDAPSLYLSKLQEDNTRIDDALVSHLIDSVALRNDDFQTFYNNRKKELITLIAKVTGKVIVSNEV